MLATVVEILGYDVRMPDVDGYEAARPRPAKEAGFDRHLVKPGGIADLQKLFADLEARSS